MSSETEHQYSVYAAALQGHLTTADDILAKVNQWSLSSKTPASLPGGASSRAPRRTGERVERGAQSARLVGDAPAVERGMGEQRAG
jgi:hypothetical protein